MEQDTSEGGVLDMTSVERLKLEKIADKAYRSDAVVRHKDAQRAELITLLSGGRRWDPDEVADAVRYWLEQTGRAFWEACRRVAWAHLEFNDKARWLEWIVDQVGLNRQHAYSYLAVAKKLAGHDDRQKLLSMGQTKAIDLCLSLEEDELRALEEGDSQLELDLDEISRMSTRELRTRLRRRERELRQSKDKFEETKASLDNAHHRIGVLTQGPPPPEQVMRDLDMAEAGFSLQFDQLIRLFDEIDWPSAHPEVMANFAAVIESARVRLIDLDRLVQDDWHIHPEIAGHDNVATLVTLDEKRIYQEIVDPPRSVAVGEVFRLEEVLPATWTWPRADWALHSLAQKGFIAKGDNPNEWVLTDAGPDVAALTPEWLRKSIEATKRKRQQQREQGT